MANCPNCGSTDIQLKQDSNVNWGRAIAGWALFGVVGGAVGAVTGENRTANAYLDCGTVWRAEDLYKLLKAIKALTSFELDISLEEDRYDLSIFITDVLPYLQKVENINDEISKLSQTIEYQKSNDYKITQIGCGGCLLIICVGIGLIVFFAYGGFASPQSGFLLFSTMLFSLFIFAGTFAEQKDKEPLEITLKRKNKELEAYKNEMNRQILVFTHRLISDD